MTEFSQNKISSIFLLLVVNMKNSIRCLRTPSTITVSEQIPNVLNWPVLAVGCSHHKILIQKEAIAEISCTALPHHNRHVWPAVRHSLMASNDSCWMNWGQKRIKKIPWYHIYIVTKLNWPSLTLLFHHVLNRHAKTDPVTTDSSLWIECPTLWNVLSHLQ